MGDELFAEALRVTKAKSVTDYWKLISWQKEQYVQRFYEEVCPPVLLSKAAPKADYLRTE